MNFGKQFSIAHNSFLEFARRALYHASRISPLCLAFASFWHGRPFSGPRSKPFRSASQLPFFFPRYPNLNAAAPAPHPGLSRILFRSALILFVPGVLLLAFFAIHQARSRASAIGTTLPTLRTDWQ